MREHDRATAGRTTLRAAFLGGPCAMGLLLAGCATSGAPAADDGWTLIVKQDYAAARDYYERILAENPDDPYAHLSLGVAYEELGDKTAARAHYEAAIRLGENAEVGEVADEGKTFQRRATVAELARENLARLESGG